MPDASRHCKRPALELGARWSNEALLGHPTTGFWRRTQTTSSAASRGQAFRNGARPSSSQASPRLLGPAQRPTHSRATVEAVTRGRRTHAPRARWMPSVHSPQYRDRLGSATIVAGLRCAASAREPPSSPKHSFNPPRAVAPLPALNQEHYASPARTRAL
jgi:hypothetical protein